MTARFGERCVRAPRAGGTHAMALGGALACVHCGAFLQAPVPNAFGGPLGGPGA